MFGIQPGTDWRRRVAMMWLTGGQRIAPVLKEWIFNRELCKPARIDRKYCLLCFILKAWKCGAIGATQP